MAFHHVAIAVKDADRAHRFYTEAMGFTLVKIVKRKTPEGGWTKHIFYDTGDGELFAIWDLRGLEGEVLNDADWRGGLSTGAGLPYWVNHLAFDCDNIDGLEVAMKRWLDHGYHVTEVKHEFIHSVYTRDPDGTLVEFTYDTQPLGSADIVEANELLVDNTPATEPDYEGSLHRSPHYQERKQREAAEAANSQSEGGDVDAHAGSSI